MTRPWWDGLTPATAFIDCGENRHRLEWAQGELRALDHADIDGDRTLWALGGDAYPCLAAIDAWERHGDDLRVLALTSRGPSDPVRPPDGPRLRRGGGGGNAGGGWFMYAPNSGVMHGSVPQSRLMTGRAYSFLSAGGGGPTSPGDPDDFSGLAGLLGLGGGLTRRLAASVVATWVDRVEAGAGRAEQRMAECEAALFGRVTCSVREWLDDPRATVDLTMIAAHEEPTLERDEATIHARLPFRWLLDVWAHELAHLAGNFSLQSMPVDEGVTLRVVRRDFETHMLNLTTS